MRIWLRAGTFVVVAGTLVGIAVSTGREHGVRGGGPPAGAVQLVAYPNCAQMLHELREHTARNIGPWGLPGQNVIAMKGSMPAAVPSAAGAADSAPPAAVPEHSTTTVHEAGVDEPDLVKTDGRRIVTVVHGVLYVVDTATRQVTGSVRLVSRDQGWTPSDLLVHGDRALVIVPQVVDIDSTQPSLPRPYQPRSRFVLVDLSGAPEVAGSLTVSGRYVDARLVGSTVRLVALNQPELRIPPVPGNKSPQQRLADNRAAVRKLPLSAWLPRYQITDGSGATSNRSVGCGRVSHPRDYTGTSMLTVYSVDLTRGLGAIPPISLAADGDIVYGTTSSLYVASNPQWWQAVPIALPASPRSGSVPPPMLPVQPKRPPQQTSIHRFDITGAGAPRYVASGTVPGRLLNQYSLSDYDGYLRVATTSGDAFAPGEGPASTSSSAVYELNADTMKRAGSVGGLGKGQRIYSVRFVGAVGYVVTFQQMDPLYTLDLRNPSAPRVAGELELSGYSAYLSPAGDGRLLGVGQEANQQGRAQGLQVSLFDVRDPARPSRLARFVQPGASSAAEYDPHAFLYWPASGTAVLPTEGSALVLTVGSSRITSQGSIAAPSTITRAMVIGNSLWTLSDEGLQVNAAATLARQAWIPLG